MSTFTPRKSSTKPMLLSLLKTRSKAFPSLNPLRSRLTVPPHLSVLAVYVRELPAGIGPISIFKTNGYSPEPPAASTFMGVPLSVRLKLTGSMDTFNPRGDTPITVCLVIVMALEAPAPEAWPEASNVSRSTARGASIHPNLLMMHPQDRNTGSV